MFHNYYCPSRIVIATAKKHAKRGETGAFDGSLMYRTSEKESGTDPRHDSFARAGTTRFGFGARPLCAYVGGIGSRALNPNLHLSALKRLSNGTRHGRWTSAVPSSISNTKAIAPISESSEPRRRSRRRCSHPPEILADLKM